jgi:hypothetical protein
MPGIVHGLVEQANCLDTSDGVAGGEAAEGYPA